jgi:hypothetical protein
MHTLVKIDALPESAADLPVVKLPGFTSDGVTYEAFSFELRFAAPAAIPTTSRPKPS